MLDEFYLCMGWDGKTGVPTREKLNELGLVKFLQEMGVTV